MSLIGWSEVVPSSTKRATQRSASVPLTKKQLCDAFWGLKNWNFTEKKNKFENQNGDSEQKAHSPEKINWWVLCSSEKKKEHFTVVNVYELSGEIQMLGDSDSLFLNEVCIKGYCGHMLLPVGLHCPLVVRRRFITSNATRYDCKKNLFKPFTAVHRSVWLFVWVCYIGRQTLCFWCDPHYGSINMFNV